MRSRPTKTGALRIFSTNHNGILSYMRHLLLSFLLGLSLHAWGQDLDSLYREAQHQIGQFQFDKALKLLSTCYIQQPEHIPYLQQIGYCHYQMGRYTDATLFYRQALKQDSTNLTSLSFFGTLAEKQQRLTEAQPYFRKLVELDTANSYYFKRNAQLAERLRQPLYALENYLQAYRLNERDAEVAVALAGLYMDLEQLDYAEKILDKGLELAPQNLKLQYAWARLQNLKQDYPEVIRALQTCLAQGDTSHYFQMMLGAAYVLEDSLEQGIWHLEQVVKRNKAPEAAFHYLGLACRQVGELQKSKQYMLKAIDKGTSERLGTYYDDLSAIEEEQGHLRPAIDYLREAIRYEPQPERWFRLARLSDQYYKDKTIAMRYYKEYLQTEDNRWREYSELRLKDLREWQHMKPE